MRYTDFHTSFTRRGSHCAFNRAEPHNSAGQRCASARRSSEQLPRGGGRGAGKLAQATDGIGAGRAVTGRWTKRRRGQEVGGAGREEVGGISGGEARTRRRGRSSRRPRRRPRARQSSAPPLAGAGRISISGPVPSFAHTSAPCPQPRLRSAQKGGSCGGGLPVLDMGGKKDTGTGADAGRSAANRRGGHRRMQEVGGARPAGLRVAAPWTERKGIWVQ